MGRLGAHADSLLPLAAHQADAMLAEAGRVRRPARSAAGHGAWMPLRVLGQALQQAHTARARCACTCGVRPWRMAMLTKSLALHPHTRLTHASQRLQGTSVDGDPYAAHLRLRLLPDSTSAISAQASAAGPGWAGEGAFGGWALGGKGLLG